jgi:hypothetical protein
MIRIFFSLFLPTVLVFSQTFEGIPKTYQELLKEIFNKSPAEVNLSLEGDTFTATINKLTPEGFLRIELTDDSFLSFYYKLEEILLKKKPKEVSIKVILNNEVIPFNPFYQIWDKKNEILLLKFSKLKPMCKPPVITITAEGKEGIQIWVSLEEIKKHLLEKNYLPAYYCF